MRMRAEEREERLTQSCPARSSAAAGLARSRAQVRARETPREKMIT